jgi:hypothetical protein
MRLSEERVASLARRITDALLEDELVDLEIEEERFTFLVEKLILDDLRLEDEIDTEATERLRRQKPYLEDGTSEWEIEFDKVKNQVAGERGYIIY